MSREGAPGGSGRYVASQQSGQLTVGQSCRACGTSLGPPVLDLGLQPEANVFPWPDDPTPDPMWPLLVYLCDACALVQLDDGAPSEVEEPGLAGLGRLSSDISAHSAALAAQVGTLAAAGRVLEFASHGNYLAPDLAGHGIRPVIVEGSPDLATALAAEGHSVVPAVLNATTARTIADTEGRFDVIVDGYLLPHMLDPDGFVAGLELLLAPRGTMVLEINHLLPMVVGRQFDAFRHGHFAYVSLMALIPLLARHGLRVESGALLDAYGGTLRAVVRHEADVVEVDDSVQHILALEAAAGLGDRAMFVRLGAEVGRLRAAIRATLVEAADAGRTVAGYGAPSRATALVNACGLGPDVLPYTVDRSAYKQGRTLGGTRTPIRSPEALLADRPDVVLVLLWNMADEVARQLSPLTDLGTSLIVPIPAVGTIG